MIVFLIALCLNRSNKRISDFFKIVINFFLLLPNICQIKSIFESMLLWQRNHVLGFSCLFDCFYFKKLVDQSVSCQRAV